MMSFVACVFVGRLLGHPSPVEKREFTDEYTTHKVKIGSKIQMEAARSMEVVQ